MSELDAAYSILVEECGAREGDRHAFIRGIQDQRGMTAEYRFQGTLGFGGKYYEDRMRCWVSCYREDETPERLTSIRRANERLACKQRA